MKSIVVRWFKLTPVIPDLRRTFLVGDEEFTSMGINGRTLTHRTQFTITLFSYIMFFAMDSNRKIFS